MGGGGCRKWMGDAAHPLHEFFGIDLTSIRKISMIYKIFFGGKDVDWGFWVRISIRDKY